MNLVCHPCAVSDRKGPTRLLSPRGFEGSSRLPETQEEGSGVIDVNTITLDEALVGQRADLLKVDVEGFELRVMEGARETIRAVKWIVIEAHTSEHLWRIQRFLGSGWDCKQLGVSDYLFTPADGTEDL